MNLQDQIKQLEEEIREAEEAEEKAYNEARSPEMEPESEAWYAAWQEEMDIKCRLKQLYRELDRLNEEADEEFVEIDGRQFVAIDAGGAYGVRRAWYEVISNILVLRHEGDHDNLAGNHVSADFEGLTLEEAQGKAKAINSEPVGHDYDGCHACTFGVCVWEPGSEAPRFLTYTEPAKNEIVSAALAVYHKEPGSMRRLKEAVRNAE